MIRRTLIAVVVAGALGLPTGAAAEPSTLAVAKLGKLKVLSSVIFKRKSVEMRGGWRNDNQPCSTERRLFVRATIKRKSLNPAGGSGASFFRVTRSVMNCAEGGPNLGFRLVPSDGVQTACPDGRWKRGHYRFTTLTRHRASGLTSVATLRLTRRRAC
jgi:hypothetical protein